VCECPTHPSGYSKAKFPIRKPKTINRLVQLGDLADLKAMLQNYLRNSFNQVCFGQHNDMGIFGACPGEILYLISLGCFISYSLKEFITWAGAYSLALKQYHDSLCAAIGRSHRDLPKMNLLPERIFLRCKSDGTWDSGLPVGWVILHVSPYNLDKHFGRTRWRQVMIILPKYNYSASIKNHLADWIIVVPSLLQWHKWRKQSSIPKSKLHKSEPAVQ
jgi:hypothetical protein